MTVSKNQKRKCDKGLHEYKMFKLYKIEGRGYMHTETKCIYCGKELKS